MTKSLFPQTTDKYITCSNKNLDYKMIPEFDINFSFTVSFNALKICLLHAYLEEMLFI